MNALSGTNQAISCIFFGLLSARLLVGFINYSKAASNKFITYFVEQKSKGDGVHSGKKKLKKNSL